jgi:enamine deaminase RidA (YjgF/YER057c/UK114 family)
MTMLKKEIVPVPGLAETEGVGFAQCVVAGDFVFVAGQTGIDEEWNVVSRDFRAQAEKAFDNLRRALDAAGSSLDHIVSMTAYFADAGDIPVFSAIRRKVMPGSLCASTAVGGASFVLPELLLEIEVTAIRRPD